MKTVSLESKINSAQVIISKAVIQAKFSEDNVKDIALFSGGKDSTVTLHLIRSMRPGTVAMFNNTGVEAKETIEYVRTIPNLIENHPEKTFWQCVKEYGWPEDPDISEVMI